MKSLIDCVKQAANRYLRNEERIANTTTLNAEHSSKTVANDINERLSELGSVPCDNESLIIAGGCSGLEPLTNLVNQDSVAAIKTTFGNSCFTASAYRTRYLRGAAPS